ncbi:MAG: MerC domain-containing protein [Chitinophagaceae bacterium]
MNLRVNWDAMGITASIACAIHCAVLPLLPSGLLLFGMDIVENVAFEWFMIFLAFAVGIYALWHGYKKHHRQVLPILLFGIGILFLVSKQLWHHYQLWLLPFAVIFIVVAHFINFRLSRTHHHTEAGTCHHSKAA